VTPLARLHLACTAAFVLSPLFATAAHPSGFSDWIGDDIVVPPGDPRLTEWIVGGVGGIISGAPEGLPEGCGWNGSGCLDLEAPTLEPPVAPVPLPGAVWMMMAALIGMLWLHRVTSTAAGPSV